MIGVHLQLFNNITKQASLTDIQAVWWDEIIPKDLRLPAGQSISVTTDENGYITLDLSEVSSLEVDDYGFLLLYQHDSNDHKDSLVFAGKIQVETIVTGELLVQMDSYHFYCPFNLLEDSLDLISSQSMWTVMSGTRYDEDGTAYAENEPVINDSEQLETYGAYTQLVPYSEDTSHWTGSGPWTQSINLANTGTYTVSTNLSGATVTITAGTATIDAEASATYGSPDQFVVSGAGTVTISTDTANPKAQLTETPYAMPPAINTTSGQLSIPDNYSDADEGYKWPIGSVIPEIDNDVAWEEVDGVNILPAECSISYINENNYTEYDTSTGTGHIVSSGSFTSVSWSNFLTIGLTYELDFELVGVGTGTLKYNELGHVFTASEKFKFVATSDDVCIARLSPPVDVYFKINYIKQIQPSAAWTTCGTNLLGAFDGVADGEVESSGNLISGNYYEIITTETDHFGLGKVIGDRVTGLTTALDANNTVKQISPPQGELVVEWTPKFDYDEIVGGNSSIITVISSHYRLVYFNNIAQMKLYDGAEWSSVSSFQWQADTTYEIHTIWGTHPVEGTSKMQLIVTDGTTTWESSVVAFDGSFDPEDYLSLGWTNDSWQKIGKVKIYKKPNHEDWQ